MDEGTIQAASAALVAARLREEMTRVENVTASLGDALDRYPLDSGPDLVVIHGIGGLIHDFYTGVESVFSQITPTLNGVSPEGQNWHRDLLHSMTLALDGIRPAVVSPASEKGLLEYLRFRHVYRNMYGSRLDWPRVRELAEGIEALWRSIKAELASFLIFLDALASAVARD